MKSEQIHITKGIWTFPAVGSGLRTLYVPYLESLDKIKKGCWVIRFSRGDSVTADLNKIATILFYGYTGSVQTSFIQECVRYQVNILMTSRNEKYHALIYAERPHQKIAALSAQILARENQKKAVYLARTLLLKRVANTELLNISNTTRDKINQVRSIDALRQIEAVVIKRYWSKYYSELNLVELTRREDHPINHALNMGSFFLAGIISRWILANRLSPHYGFLHVSTHYPALVYDLMEPYRYIVEHTVATEYIDTGEHDLVARVNTRLREILLDDIYVVELKKTVARRGLLQGVVVALRAYLEGDMKRFVPPSEGSPNGGRPLKVSYSILGSK